MGFKWQHIPDGSEPHVSHCNVDFAAAVSISFGDTMFTLTGFTSEIWKQHEQKKNEIVLLHRNQNQVNENGFFIGVYLR